MRSPWKVIAGFVSRRDPEIYDEVVDERSVAPDPRAENPDVEVAELSRVVAFQNPSSTRRAEDHSVESSAQADDSGHAERDTVRTAVGEILPHSSLAENTEPVLATTIRLVTSDRVSVHAAVPASNVSDADAGDIPAEVHANLDGEATEPAALMNGDAEAEGESKAVATNDERTARSQSKRNARTVEAPIRNPVSRRPPPTKVEAAEDSVSRVALGPDALVLDAEINQLRNELAQKLRLQNDYMRLLLARYDVC